MKISKRLKAICDLVPKGSKVIDIGADHALTDIYLEKEKNCTCLATDISEYSILKAKENIKKYNSNVKIKLTDGLNNIVLTDEILIISGMGTNNIIKILNKKITNDIIISSHTKISDLRKFMIKKGYHIEKELALKDKYYYIITYYKYGKKKKINYIISPFLTNNQDYMEHLLNHYKMKYNKNTNFLKKIKYKYIVNKIEKATKKKKTL